ncbi:uncharacterized protein [Palaemon carinicauda]|uniref:uncharacterized protein n=1 Tax=Palaemon carinicauda TaxID=392227 RepID=UPI0035B5A31C
MDCTVWEPKEFLCGCSQRTASKVIGWMGIVFSTLHLIDTCLYTSVPYREYYDFCNQLGATDSHACAKGLISAGVILGIVSIVTAIGSVMLLWGVKKKEPVFVLVHLVIKVISIVLGGTFTLCLMLYLFFTSYAYWNYLIGVIGFLGLYLEVYFFLCVRVYYKQLKFPIRYERTGYFGKNPLTANEFIGGEKFQPEV